MARLQKFNSNKGNDLLAETTFENLHKNLKKEQYVVDLNMVNEFRNHIAIMAVLSVAFMIFS